MNAQKRPSLSRGAHEGERGGLAQLAGQFLLVDVLVFGALVMRILPNANRFSDLITVDARRATGSAVSVEGAFQVANVGWFERKGQFSASHLVSSSALAATVASQFVIERFWRAASASIAAQRVGVKRIDFAVGDSGIEELRSVDGDASGALLRAVKVDELIEDATIAMDDVAGVLNLVTSGPALSHFRAPHDLIPELYHRDTSNATKSLQESLEAA